MGVIMFPHPRDLPVPLIWVPFWSYNSRKILPLVITGL